MTLPHVALNDPHVGSHNDERDAINSLGELAFASNETGTVDTVAAGAFVNVTGLMITLDPTPGPVILEADITLQQTAAGTGNTTLAFLDYTHSAFLKSSVAPNVGVNDLRTRIIRHRIEQITERTVIGMGVGNNQDSGQTPSFNVLNSTGFPSEFTAVAG